MKTRSMIHNLRLVSRTKYGPTGQVLVDRGYAYIAPMEDVGVTMVDVRRAEQPQVVAQVPLPAGVHTKKVQVAGDVMVIAHERQPRFDGRPAPGGIAMYDISLPGKPRPLGFFAPKAAACTASGSWTADMLIYRRRRRDSPTSSIPTGVPRIIDLSQPNKPEEVGRWWIPGLWTAGGEQPNWPDGMNVRVHGTPFVVGDRCYLGCVDWGWAILDMTDLRAPGLITRHTFHPPFGDMLHTALPFPSRKLVICTQEAIYKHADPRDGEKFMWIVDVREERNPISVAAFRVRPDGLAHPDYRFGPHNIHENRPGSLQREDRVYLTYFAGGLRIVDIKDPMAPQEIAWYVPEVSRPAPQSNDVYVDSDGLIYLVDRFEGVLDILEHDGI